MKCRCGLVASATAFGRVVQRSCASVHCGTAERTDWNTCCEKGSATEGASRRVYEARLKPCPSTEPAPSRCAEAWFGVGRVGAPSLRRNVCGTTHLNFSVTKFGKCKGIISCGLQETAQGWRCAQHLTLYDRGRDCVSLPWIQNHLQRLGYLTHAQVRQQLLALGAAA